MASLEQPNAAKRSDDTFSEMELKIKVECCLQEPKDVELIDIFDTGVGECEDCPSELEEGDVQRSVDLFSISVNGLDLSSWKLTRVRSRFDGICPKTYAALQMAVA